MNNDEYKMPTEKESNRAVDILLAGAITAVGALFYFKPPWNTEEIENKAVKKEYTIQKNENIDKKVEPAKEVAEIRTEQKSDTHPKIDDIYKALKTVETKDNNNSELYKLERFVADHEKVIKKDIDYVKRSISKFEQERKEIYKNIPKMDPREKEAVEKALADFEKDRLKQFSGYKKMDPREKEAVEKALADFERERQEQIRNNYK